MKNVRLVIVSPCDEGFAISKYGDGPLSVQPTFHKSWTRAEMRRSLKVLYPNAEVRFRENPHHVITVTSFGETWEELRPIFTSEVEAPLHMF